MHAILDMDATSLANAITQGTIGSLEIVEAYIERLEQINPQVNCLVEDRFHQAREEAKTKDEQLKHGNAHGKLFGVPISVKESFHVTGMKTTGGLRHRKHAVQTKDATVISKLKAEGAIIIGKTNTPALCFCQETDNKLYGRTNNPWDVSKTAGGSSGGEGALIAAGGAAIGIGSDIGGSIRFPSHFNGVIGFKSGNRQVPQYGSYPYVDIALQERMLGIGAIAKSVRDARLMNEIIADVTPKPRSLSSFTIVLPVQHLYYPVNRATLSYLHQLIKLLSTSFTVVDETPPYYRESALLWQLIMSIDGAKKIARIAFDKRPIRPCKEYIKEIIFQSSDLHRYLTWALIGTHLFKPSIKKVAEIERIVQDGDQKLAHYFNNRLLILPVYHSEALPHGTVYRELFSIRKTFLRYIPFVAYANVWGLPALTVPIGDSDEGLPIGVQIIGSVGNEDALFQLGEQLENHFRGYVRCR